MVPICRCSGESRRRSDSRISLFHCAVAVTLLLSVVHLSEATKKRCRKPAPKPKCSKKPPPAPIPDSPPPKRKCSKHPPPPTKKPCRKPPPPPPHKKNCTKPGHSQSPPTTAPALPPSGSPPALMTDATGTSYSAVKGKGVAMPLGNNGNKPILKNRGGPVMTQPITVHYLWVGDWTLRQKSIVKTFTDSLSAADAGATVPQWWAITRQYTDGRTKRPVTDRVSNGKEASLGTRHFASAQQVAQLVADAIAQNKLPADESAIYAVLGDEDTTQVGIPQLGFASAQFCQAFCGWHNYITLKGKRYKFFFTANAVKQCPGACIASELVTGPFKPPNGDLGVDGLVSIFAHEVAEIASDPYFTSWQDTFGNENGDLCQYMFGSTIRRNDAAVYNLAGKGGADFLVQQMWDESTQTCRTVKA